MREHLQILLAVLFVLCGGLVGYALLFSSAEEVALIVSSTAGPVQRISVEGLREDAAVGMRIAPQETLTVGPSGEASLSVGEGTRLTLEASSTVRVLGVDRSGVQVELEDGQVRARVRPGSPSLRIGSQGRSISAQDADFTVRTGPEGLLAVETAQGTVALSGMGADLPPLEPHQRLTALPGASPVVGPISEALLLQVDWPRSVATREDEVLIEGQTAPYAAITLSLASAPSAPPVRTRADAQGRFQAPFPLREGENRIRIQTRDAMGALHVDEAILVRDTRAPTVRTQVTWGEGG